MEVNSYTTSFEPRGELTHLIEDFHYNPNYLFRTSAPKTNGTTTSTLVQSAAAKHGLDTKDILNRPRNEAAEMLERHCLWKNDRNDNLTSWTSSFIFAIQLAIYRKCKDFDEPDPSSIKIHILDTRTLRRGMFLPVVPLLDAFNIHNSKIRGFAHAEYLSQGSIVFPKGAMATITYRSLMDHGLLELNPHFAKEDCFGKLACRVDQLRNSFKHNAPETPNTDDVSIAQTIATHWTASNGMRPVIMATLLSLKPRFRNEPVILKAFQDNSWANYITDDSLDCFSGTSLNNVAEHKQFVEMMYDIHADAQRQRQLRSAGLVDELPTLLEPIATFSQLNN